MKIPHKAAVAAILLSSCFSTSLAHASKMALICSYAPSQSAASAAALAAAGPAATMTAIGKAIGLTAVAHSSGASILTGSSGYVAGTMGVATAAPFIITIGVATAGVVATVELMCARRNHPSQVARITAAAGRVASNTKRLFGNTASAVKVRVIPASVKVRAMSVEAFDHAYRSISQ